MGQSGSSDMVVHYDQGIQDAYNALRWYAFDTRLSFQAEGDNWLNYYLQLQPYTYPPSDANTPYYDAFSAQGIINVWLDHDVNYYDHKIRKVDELNEVRRVNQEAMDYFIDGKTIADQLAAHNVYLEDEIVQNTLPKLKAGLRDIGAVLTSSFIDAQAMVEINKVKVLSKYAAELKMKMLDISQSAWHTYLKWQMECMDLRLKTLDTYYRTADLATRLYNEITTRNVMFPWTILDQIRAIVGSLNQAPTSKSSTINPSQMQQAGQYVGMAAGVASIIGELAPLLAAA